MEVWKFRGLEAWFCWWGSAPHPDFLSHGAKRRAAGAVSGEAVERPMEPEAVRAFPRVFAVPISSGHDCFPGSVTKPRGRTNRTYRTYRTAADAAEFPQNQSVACEARHAPQDLGPDVRLARTHGPPPASPSLCSLAVEGLALWACTVIAAQRYIQFQRSSVCRALVARSVLCSPFSVLQ